MKRKLAKFALFVYTTHIQEEWEIFTRAGRIFIYPLWFIRSALIWLICPLMYPEYILKQNKIYIAIKAAYDAGMTIAEIKQFKKK